MSPHRRKRIEKTFGWLKTADELKKTRHKGLAKTVGAGGVHFCRQPAATSQSDRTEVAEGQIRLARTQR